MGIFIHADAATRSTTGPRGSTTGRAGTKTVRGPEGSYIAGVKDELMARPPRPGYRVVCTVVYPTMVNVCRLPYDATMAMAEQRMAQAMAHDAKYPNPDCTRTYTIEPATVVWRMRGAEVVETIAEDAAR